MNILIFSSYYPFPGDLTPEKTTNVVHYFCREWVKNGHRVIVINLDIKFFNQKPVVLNENKNNHQKLTRKVIGNRIQNSYI